MCSVACAMPGIVSSSDPTPYVMTVVVTGASLFVQQHDVHAVGERRLRRILRLKPPGAS